MPFGKKRDYLYLRPDPKRGREAGNETTGSENAEPERGIRIRRRQLGMGLRERTRQSPEETATCGEIAAVSSAEPRRMSRLLHRMQLEHWRSGSFRSAVAAITP
ncbi:MAG: hypothetical protein OXC26_00140 [Albidovulum sp.]|nr:hypothetical protein [Albidovulum sp.]